MTGCLSHAPHAADGMGVKIELRLHDQNSWSAQVQELVLRSVRQLGPDCRANEIQETLTNLLHKEQAFGAVFTTLDRLTAKRFVKWEKGQPDNRRGGRAPRLYTITGDGISALSVDDRLTISNMSTEWSALSAMVGLSRCGNGQHVAGTPIQR